MVFRYVETVTLSSTAKPRINKGEINQRIVFRYVETVTLSSTAKPRINKGQIKVWC